MATKRIKDLTSTATAADLLSGRYGVLDTPEITKRLPGNLLGGGGGGGDTGILVFEVSYSESIADYIYPTYQEVSAAVSAGNMPVILLYVHNSPIRRCFVFRWLSGGYIHFDNNSQYVEISNENVVETGYIQNVLIYTFSGSNYPSADDISLAIANGHDIMLCKYAASSGGISHVHYRLNKYLAITSGITIEFYPTDNSMDYIKAFKDLTATEPTWVWSLENTNVMNMIGNVETLLAAL